eukprot:scaffold4108_cov56-Phaeocystis_antarctica.AAC.2
MRRLAARYPPHRSSGLTWLLTATNWAQKASPRRPKLAKGEICKEVADRTDGSNNNRLHVRRGKRQNKSLVNHFHQTLTYLPGSAAGCHSSTKPPVRNTSDAASRPPYGFNLNPTPHAISEFWTT